MNELSYSFSLNLIPDMKPLIFTSLLFFILLCTYAQSEVIAEMESDHKVCLQIKPDSIACSRNYFFQTDSMLDIIFNKVKTEIPSDEQMQLMKEQLSWAGKKNAYFSKQDINFAYNIKEGTWKKEMIRFVYENKGDFILKRIKILLKKLNQ